MSAMIRPTSPANAAASAVAVSVHAYSPPLTEMTRYDLTPGGLVKRDTQGAAAW